MKKLTVRIFAAIMALLMLASAVGCYAVDLPTVTYDIGGGLSIKLPAALQEVDAEDSEVKAFANGNISANFTYDSFKELAELGLENVTFEEYAELSQAVNEKFTDPYTPDENGHLATTYTVDVDGELYFYYVTIREGRNGFWIITFTCKDSAKDKYLDKFTEWNDSIVIELE